MRTPILDSTPKQQLPRDRQPRWLRRTLWLAIAVLVAGATYYLITLPVMSRWGATDAEVAAIMPGDDLVPNATLRYTRGMTVNATPAEIYPWLRQMGIDRAGLYTYEAVENALGLHVQNADRIHPEWQAIQVGDFLRFTPADYFITPGPGIYVEQMEPDRAFVLCFGMESGRPKPCTSTWQFLLTAQKDSTTRLILRSNNYEGENAALNGIGRLFQLLTFTMEDGMLRGIKARAEAM
jgi:hypothetical protein